MTKVKTVTEAMSAIEEAAECGDPCERFARTMPLEAIAHQGDIYVQRVAEDWPRGKPISERQLAPGNTKGSRHVVRAGEGVELFESGVTQAPLIGPVAVAPGRWHIDHPEHGTWSLPGGTYRVGYQRDFEREEISRVAD